MAPYCSLVSCISSSFLEKYDIFTTLRSPLSLEHYLSKKFYHSTYTMDYLELHIAIFMLSLSHIIEIIFVFIL